MLRRKGLKVRKGQTNSSLTRRFFIGFLILILVIALCGSIWYGSRLESLTIVKVNVVGGDTVSHEEIKSIVESELEGEYFKVIPKRFSWFYPKEKILSDIKTLPKVKEVTIDKPNNKTVEVHFVEYSPVALWCKNLDSESSCLFLDETGYAYSEAPILRGNAMPRYFTKAEPKQGEKPFTYEFIKDTLVFTKVAREDFNFVARGIEKVGDDEAVFDLHGGGQLKITLRQPIDLTIENLRAILASEEFSDISPGNFNYIDLRFGDKVFVNEVEEEMGEETNATSTGEVAL